MSANTFFESREAIDKAKYALHFDVNDPPVLEYISRCFHVLLIGFQLLFFVFKQMYLSQKIGANLVRFVTSVHVANIFKVSNICKSPQKNLHAFAGEDEDSKAQHF